MSNNLPKRLREFTERHEVGGGVWYDTPPICIEAADCIEELEKEVDKKEAIIRSLKNPCRTVQIGDKVYEITVVYTAEEFEKATRKLKSYDKTPSTVS